MQELLTIKSISQNTGIPESTLLYYRNTYSNYIPTIGTGRRKRCYPLAVDIFMTISNSAKQGMDKMAIIAILEKEYPCINVTQDHTQGTLQYNNEKTNEGKTLLIDSYKQMMQQMTSLTVNMIAQQKEEIHYLYNEIEQLKEAEKRVELQMLDRVSLLENQLCQMIKTKTKEMVVDTIAERFKKAE